MARKLICSLLMCTSIGIHAEPSKTVTYLMNEPLSMWDYGLYQLDNRLMDISLIQSGKISKTKFFATSSYDFESNRITIFASTPLDLSNIPSYRFEASSITVAKAYCKDMIGSVRSRLNANNRQLFAVTGQNSSVCGYFKHNGFKNALEPSNICNELESMIEIKTLVEVKDGVAVRCNGALINESIYYSQ